MIRWIIPMRRRLHIPVLLAVIALLLLPSLGGAQSDDTVEARRIADIAAIALDEYGIGVRDGRVVNEDELREARLFLAEARRAGNVLPADARSRVLPLLDRLVDGVAKLEDEQDLRGTVTTLREALEETLGITLDPLPSTPPSLAHGARLYSQYCLQCHGESGAGDGALAGSMDPPPADLTDRAALGATSPIDFFRVINVGVAGTAMPAMGDQLTLDERWALALYASTLRHSRADERRGALLLGGGCNECRVLVSDFHRTAMLGDDSLAAALAAQATWPDSVRPEEVVAYARLAGAVEELGTDRSLAVARTVSNAKAEVAAAASLAGAGQVSAAAARALDAYLVFERIESGVRARDPRLADRVERAFTQYRASLLSGAPMADVAVARNEVDAVLDEALARTVATASPTVLFGQSLVILVREGLEAILIIGALMAFLAKAGATERKRDIGTGVLAAVGASALTAIGFATVFRAATRHQEVLEGVTMLVAAAVLFWVSYWLVSKIEIRKWQEFVREQMTRALASKRAVALGAVAFLAVYREGFETVLFYAALFSTSNGSAAGIIGILGGVVVGAALLIVLYVVMQRGSLRLPLKPFFAVTSGLLYVMAFTFAGQGIAELQAAGLVTITPLKWMPVVPLLGIFPTTQTLAIQLFFAAALSGALLWVFWLEPRTARARI